MAGLSVLAFLLNAVVVVRGALYLATTRPRRLGEREIVLAVIAISTLHMLARVVVWMHPSACEVTSVAAGLFTAYAVSAASLFLALIACFAHNDKARANRRGAYG